LKYKIYSLKANEFFNLQKKLQKIMLKIEIIGTCLNLQKSLKGTLHPLGLNIQWQQIKDEIVPIIFFS